MTTKMGKHAGDRLFHAISRDKDTTNVHFIYFPHHKVEATHVLNRLPCILSEEILTKPNNLITRSGIERATMGIWDKEKHTFTNPSELHNEEATEGMFEGTGLTTLYLDQEPQSALKRKMGNFDEADIQKDYARAQGKDDEIITIASISRQIGRKIQARTNTESPSGFNKASTKDPSITS